MDEDLKEQESISIQTEVQTSVNQETKQTLDSFPRIEDLRKSEQEVKINTKVEGTTQVEQDTFVQDRVFTRKSDEKKVHLKKRLKIVTAVYVTVASLLLTFVVSNIATMAILNKTITKNTDIIQTKQTQLMVEESKSPTSESIGEFQISLNEPRDYSEDKKELTWLDKITILFRNIFS